MARTWLSIGVELVGGHGQRFWPRPGRIFAAARSHTFAELAEAIDEAFARWDLSHLHEFRLEEDRRIGIPDEEWDGDRVVLDDRKTRLGLLKPGERFQYVFDFGDDWTHLCTVDPKRVDPDEVLGIVPSRPLAYWGWGAMPDQYGRRWSEDDGESPLPPDPRGSDLPGFFDPWAR